MTQKTGNQTPATDLPYEGSKYKITGFLGFQDNGLSLFGGNILSHATSVMALTVR